jgi:hypothetical protein
MSYNLQSWNKFISESLCPEELEQLRGEEFMNEILERTMEQNEQVKYRIIEDLLERTKIKDKRQYIKVTQVMLVHFLDKLYSYGQQKRLKPEVKKLYETLTGYLENTLAFIRNIFGNYFDFNAKASLVYRKKSLTEVKKQIGKMVKIVKSLSTSSCELNNLLLENFTSFSSDVTMNITYRDLDYHKTLLRVLLKDGILSSEERAREVLFYYNYNEDRFLEFLYRRLSQLSRLPETVPERIAAIRLEQKIMNQLPVMPADSFNPRMPSLRVQLNQWIEEEVKFLQRDELMVSSNGQSFEKKENSIFVHVPFRGTEIYLLHKAFIDSGGAAGETYKSLFEKTASHLTNNNQRGFSTESLQKNSDKINYEVKDNVRRFLQKMIRNIESY